MSDKWLCLRCRAEIEQSADLKACPSCGDASGVPASTKDRVTVTITWHELRVLVMWAENWAFSHKAQHPEMPKVVYGISDALQLQHLDKPGLTFASEIADLKEEFGEKNVQVVRMDERANYPTPPEES